MGFLHSSCSITRFSVCSESFSQDFWLNIQEKLQNHSFKDIDDTLEERSWGWTNIDDMLDTKWAISPPNKGEYIAFALRLETRRIPPGVLKKHLAIALCNEKMSTQQNKKIHYEKKRAIQDTVYKRLLKSFLPVPAIFDVAWNTHTNFVYLGSIDNKIIDLFSNFFTVTFNISLTQQTPYNLAKQVYTEISDTVFDQLTPTRFV